MKTWTEHLRALQRYSCQCGSGGAMSCDDDCPGDTTDSTVKEALIDIITSLRGLEEVVYDTSN